MFRRKNRRERSKINAGSMADIAFLLLIFFLVTTTILVDSGIAVRLPPWVEDQVIQPVADRNVFAVKINTNDQLLVEKQVIQPEQLKQITKDFINNPTNSPNRPSSPTKAVVSLMHDRGTSYGAYLSVYNELTAAYHELWEQASQSQYGKSYEELSKAKQKNIRKQIPLVISEAEPVEYD
jgi:biopolymer transport protein ExbD